MSDVEGASESDFQDKETGLCCKRVERKLEVEFGGKIEALKNKIAGKNREGTRIMIRIYGICNFT